MASLHDYGSKAFLVLKDRAQFLQELGIQAVTDCKSILDHLQTFASPSSVSDKRVAIDLVILIEIC